MIERPLPHFLFLTLLLSACAVKAPDFNAPAGDDVALRHPIELRQSWQELTLPAVTAFDAREREQIAAFVSDWQRFGSGPLFIRLPSTEHDEKRVQTYLAQTRKALTDAGAPGPYKTMRETWRETSRTAQIILSFARMSAQVVTPCGDWRENIASSAAVLGENHIYENFGCAYQNMIAAQTADPRDLVNARAQTPIDGQMRVRALTRLREESASRAATGGGH